MWSELVETIDPDGSGADRDTAILVAAGKTRIFEIAGADKVRVTHDGEDDEAAERVFLLLSTF